MVLRVIRPDGRQKLVRTTAVKCSIGSGANCTVRLEQLGVDTVHCLILRGKHQTVIRRWSDETRLNGKRFTNAPLRAGDRLRIGPFLIEVISNCTTHDSVSGASTKGQRQDDSRAEMRAAELELARRAKDLEQESRRLEIERENLLQQREVWHHTKSSYESKTSAHIQKLKDQIRDLQQSVPQQALERKSREESFARRLDEVIASKDEERQRAVQELELQHTELESKRRAREEEGNQAESKLTEQNAQLVQRIEELETACRRHEDERIECEKEFSRQLEEARKDDESPETTPPDEEHQRTLQELELQRTELESKRRAWEEEVNQAESKLTEQNAQLVQRIEELETVCRRHEDERIEREKEFSRQLEEAKELAHLHCNENLDENDEKPNQLLEEQQAEFESQKQAWEEQRCQSESQLRERSDQLLHEQEKLAREQEEFCQQREAWQAEQTQTLNELKERCGQLTDQLQDAEQERSRLQSEVDRLTKAVTASTGDGHSAVDEPTEEQEITFESPGEKPPTSAMELLAQRGFELPPDDSNADDADALNSEAEPAVRNAMESKAAHLHQAVPADMTTDDDDEASIEDYMNKLLNRSGNEANAVNQGNAEDVSTTRKPQMQSSKDSPEKSPAESKLNEPLALRPRSSRLDLTSDRLAAMRDLANESARSAINRSTRTRWIYQVTGKVIVASVALGSSFLLWKWSETAVSLEFITACAAALIGAFWALRALVLANQIRIALRPLGGKRDDTSRKAGKADKDDSRKQNGPDEPLDPVIPVSVDPSPTPAEQESEIDLDRIMADDPPIDAKTSEVSPSA